jgi:hypothetical protein
MSRYIPKSQRRMGRDAQGEFWWRSSNQLRGVQASLQQAITSCEDGANVTIDLKTAYNLLEVIRQAKHTEVGHEPSEAEIQSYESYARKARART